MSVRTMPFGRYKGQPLTALPDDYLQWVRKIKVNHWLHEDLQDEWRRRQRAKDAPDELLRQDLPVSAAVAWLKEKRRS